MIQNLREWRQCNGYVSKQRYAAALGSFTAHLNEHQFLLLAQARAETQAFVTLAVALAVVILLLFVAGEWVALRSLSRS